MITYVKKVNVQNTLKKANFTANDFTTNNIQHSNFKEKCSLT